MRKIAVRGRTPADPSLPLPSADHERFAQLVAGGASLRSAYREAGFGEATTNGGRVVRQLGVEARVAYLREQAAPLAVERVALSRQVVGERILEVLDRCMQAVPVCDAEGEPTGDWRFDAGNALKALALLGKELGMFEGQGGQAPPNPDEARRYAYAQLVLGLLRDPKAVIDLALTLKPHDALCHQLITIWRAA